MLRLVTRTRQETPRTLAVLPGSFHPPTIAHLALAQRAAAMADEVLFLLPEALPHKSFGEIGLASRLGLLAVVAGRDGMSVGCTVGGLYLEMATACARHFPGARIAFVCGRDAAERILAWPYPDPIMRDRLFSMAELWVFAREGTFVPPPELRGSIACFDFDERLQRISASEVRRRIAVGEEWQSLVPECIQEEVERLYSHRVSRTQG